MNNIVSNLSVATLIAVILLSISLLVVFLTIYFLDKYIFYFHEYGHILKIIKNLHENKYDYKKDINTDIVIQVIEYTTFFNFITFKRKTYSNYFEYLKNKKQESKYQSIIKDIAIGGYEFSKQLENYKSFHILHTIFIISTTITMILLLVLISAISNKIIYIQPILNILVIIPIIFVAKGSYKLFLVIYKYRCKIGYGKKPINTHKKGMNDCYIHEYPNQFAYTNREEDKEHTKGNPKILLDIMIDISDIKNIEPKTIYKNNIYRKITKNFPLSNKRY